MSVASDAPSPNLSELMRLFKMSNKEEAQDEPLDRPSLPPPAPAVVMQPRQKPTERAAQIIRGDTFADVSRVRTYRSVQPSAGGWNSSTQVAKTGAKPLKHQILCRNFVPPTQSAAVDRKTTDQLLQRLSKATISSRMKGTALTNTVVEEIGAPKAIEIDRKRLHLQQRQAKQKAVSQGTTDRPPSGRESVELLLFYRKEVEKRLRADPFYALHQDSPSY